MRYASRYALLLAAGLLSGAAGQTYSAPRAGAWRVLGPGGGGAQFNPTVSPVDPNLILVNCDMTGAYISTDGGDSWRMFNLHGVVRFFVPDPVDSNIIYASTGSLYRSKDKGRTWTLIQPKPGDVGKIVIAGDHAEERILTRNGSQARVDALAVDPSDSSVLFTAVSQDGRTRLYRSGELAGDLPAAATRIYVDPLSPRANRTVYIAAGDSVSVLENGVLRQQKGPGGVRRFLDIEAGFPGGGKKPVFYAVSGINWRGGSTGPTGLFVSSDGGATWNSIPIDFLSEVPAAERTMELRAVGTSLNHPETAYLSFRDHTRSIPASRRSMGVAKTTDYGKSWQIVWRDTDTSAAANIQDPWINTRFGPGWGENPFALGVSPTNPNLCFGTDFGRTMRTRDGGKTWQGVYARRLADGGSTTTGLDVLTTHGIFFDPFDPDHWFVGFTDIGLFESRGRGQWWKEASSRGIPRDWENTAYWLVFDPQVKGRIWAVVSAVHDLPRPKMWRGRGVNTYRGGVVTSEDGGRTWKPSSDGMPETAPTHIVLDSKSPVDSRTLYVSGFGKGVFKSTDGGRHWSLKNNGIEGNEPFAWRLIPDSKGRLYLLVARRSDDGSIGNAMDGAIYRSSDGAEHWEKLSLPAGCNGPNGLAVDTADPNRLYLAAWGRSASSGDAGGGIFLSKDAGITWKNVLSQDQHIFDITLDPRNAAIAYATGFESSVWKSVNHGESWTRLKGYNFKWGQRVFPDPHDPQTIYVCTYGGSIWRGPAEGDPDAIEDIVNP